MNRVIITAGLAAIGVASLKADSASSLSSSERVKPWSVSASLRGFYDDNYTTLPAVRPLPTLPTQRSSWGLELRPSAAYNMINEQTTLGLNYTYDMKYYADRNGNSADHSHEAGARLTHSFTERYNLAVSDSFVIAQEPELLSPIGGALPTLLRTDGNNIRNTATIVFNAEMTRALSSQLSYANTLYDYEEKGVGSRDALLSRMEHLAGYNLRWQVVPSTTAVFGYQFGVVNYSGKSGLDVADTIKPKFRDNQSHYLFAGVDQFINNQLSVSVRGGAQLTEYVNYKEAAAAGYPIAKDTINPYFDASGNWAFLPGSSLQVGVRHQRNQTDIGSFTISATPTVDAESTTTYAMANYKVTPRIMLTGMGQYQISTFKGGQADNQSDSLYLVGVTATYEINKFLSAEAGYNYDKLSSDLPDRSFDRNRVYIGIRGNY